MITPELLRTLNPNLSRADAEIAADKLWWVCQMDKYRIVRPLEVAHFLSQLAHESGFVPQEENLNYSAKRLTQVWPARFPTLQAAEPFAGNPRALGNKVYGGRMGNNLPDDGYNYRGRGYIQLTGKAAYRQYSPEGHDLVKNPDLLLQHGISALAAAEYWTQNGLGRLAMQDDLKTITRRINGGFNGLSDRQERLRKAKKFLNL